MRGGFVVLRAQSLKFALRLASTAVLARLLAPQDFGLVAMVFALTSFLALFGDLGLSTATVQRAEVTQAQVSNLFWINVVLGGCVALLCAGSAPLVAWFYAEPRLTAVTLVLASGFLFSALSVQHQAMLRRQMRFSLLARVDVLSLIAGLSTGVALAALGAGLWSLVISDLVVRIVYALGVWTSTDWRPARFRRGVGTGPLLAFGGSLTGFNIANYLSRSADDVLLGRAVGSAALGLYSKAYQLLLLPVQRISGPVSSIAIPTLSRLQVEPERFRSFYLQAMLLICAVGMPAVVFLFVTAEAAIGLVLGDQWSGAVILFQVLAPAAFVGTFNVAGSWVCTPLGRTHRLLRWQIVATTLTIGAFLIGIRWEALGVAAAFSISTVLLRLPGLAYLLHDSPVRLADVLRTIARPALASFAAGAGLFALITAAGFEGSRVIVLALGGALFLGLYVVVWNATPGGRRSFGMLLRLSKELRA